jgi:hypothetical protein
VKNPYTGVLYSHLIGYACWLEKAMTVAQLLPRVRHEPSASPIRVSSCAGAKGFRSR